MKKVLQKILLVIPILCGITSLHAQGVYYETITKDDAQKYLAKLYSDMQALHPNVYEYISKEEYDKVYNELIHKLDTAEYYDPDKLYSAFQEFVALCKDGHSWVGVWRKNKPNKEKKDADTAPVQKASTVDVFPFIFNIVKEKMYINANCVEENAIPVKSEIVSIGDMSVKEWLQKKRSIMSKERNEYKDAYISRVLSYKILNSDSCRYGYIPYGVQDTLYKTLHSMKINPYEDVECWNNFYNYRCFYDEGIQLAFRVVDSGRIGIISMGHFDPVKKMLPFINQALDSLKFYGAENLIIDLRESPGGHAESGFALIDRITNKPYRIEAEEHVFIKHAMLTSSNEHMRKIWRSKARGDYVKKRDVKPLMKAGRDTVIIHRYPEITPKDYKNKFTGRIWVLTSSFTFSAAAGFAAIVQDCKLGIVVGEETGGVPNTYGNPMNYTLTGVLDEKLIKFYYFAPYIKCIRPSGDDSMKLRGVIPDIEIEPNIILREDIQLQTLIEIIRKQAGD
jgi:hypothetical protein